MLSGASSPVIGSGPSSPRLGSDTATNNNSYIASDFYQDDFNAISYVDNLRTKYPLEDIKTQLEQTVNTLNDELLSIIDSDYALFLSLSSDLGRVDAAVSVLRAPLKHLEERINALREAISQPIKQSRDIETSLIETRYKKQLIQERLAAIELRDSLRNDLSSSSSSNAELTFKRNKVGDEGYGISSEENDSREVDTEENDEDENDDELTKLVKASQRYTQLLYADYPAEHVSMRHTLEQRLESILRMEFENHQDSKETKVEVVSKLLTSYACIGSFDAVQGVFKQQTSSSSISNQNKSSSSSSKIGGKTTDNINHIPEIINSILGNESVQVLIEAALKSKLSSFDFLAKSLWNQLIPNPGEIVKIEDAQKVEALRILLSKASLSGEPSISPKWNYRVYCEVLFEKAMKVYETHCKEFLSSKSQQNGSLALPIKAALQIIWNDSYVKKASDQRISIPGSDLVRARLFRSSIKLFSRYREWLQTTLESTTNPISFTSPVVIELKKLALDIETHNVIPLFTDTEKGKVASEKALKILADQIQGPLIGNVLGKIAEKIIASCNDEIQAHTRAVTSLYRMSGREPPKGPSATAGKMIKPLQNEIELARLEINWTKGILEAVATKLANAVEEIMKREEALKNLQRKAANAGVDDSTKIKMQLQFDAEKYISDCVDIIGENEVAVIRNILGSCF